METRRLFTAMIAALAVYVLYTYFYHTIFPPPPPPEAGRQAVSSTTQPGGPEPAAGGGATSAPARALFLADSSADQAPIKLGGEGAALQLDLSPVGGSVATLRLTERKGDRYRYRMTVQGDDPYELVKPVDDGAAVYRSFVTARAIITADGETSSVRLDEVAWRVAEATERRVVFETLVRPAEGGPPRLRLRKSYELAADKPLFDVRLDAENLGESSVSVAFEQHGPIGISPEQFNYDLRFLIGATLAEGEITAKPLQVRALRKSPSMFKPAPEESFAWTALSNKYFAVATRPLPSESGEPAVIDVTGDLASPLIPGDRRGDLRARILTRAVSLAGGATEGVTFEIYAGSKDIEDLAAVHPAFVEDPTIDLAAMRNADARCCCTFAWLTNGMVGLISGIHSVVRNYGLAIIVLVLIIRTLLHPLAVFQQKSMYRTQEGMGRIQPKMAALKVKHKDDRVKLNQEMMRLYHDEGVNPMAPFVGMIPMFIQMPILIALWTGINTDVHLRHQPFDGWWITDLSSPDAFIRFSAPLSIPVLSWLPSFIGNAFKDIPSFNLLPILMGASMWLQQRYMPKPHMEEKIKAANEARAQGREPETGMGGMSIEDQMRQQNMIANVMAIMFPLMFYYMPSGLTLYWLATNVYGIFESMRIRKQIDRDKLRRKEREANPGPVQPGIVGRFFKKIAEQAEDLQKQADTVTKAEKLSPSKSSRQKKQKRNR
jgi:YidC/Oxa1 family membrane protein insertase